jgi:lipid-A-disaccharide synthase
MQSYRLFILAGEASGDQHAGRLAAALHAQHAGLQMEGWGGEHMERAGVRVLKHYRELAFMGFIEVVKNLGTIWRNFKRAKKQILAFKPDVLVLVDYPGFNLRMAKWAHKKGIPVVYYISPQIWAWKAQRGYDIKKYVDSMLCILPFEPSFYERFEVNAIYTGHPLTEQVADYLENNPGSQLAAKQTIALLPGSRTQEIQAILPVFLEVVRLNPDREFVVAMAPSQPVAVYAEIMESDAALHGMLLSNVTLSDRGSYLILAGSEAALVASGTATLETALFKVPQIVCYKGSRVSYEIARRVIKVKYISLVNLILDRPFLTELIQDACQAKRIDQCLKKLEEQVQLRYFENGYSELQALLRSDESPSQYAARCILDFLHKRVIR